MYVCVSVTLLNKGLQKELYLMYIIANFVIRYFKKCCSSDFHIVLVFQLFICHVHYTQDNFGTKKTEANIT